MIEIGNNKQTINQSINQSTNQSTNQSINQTNKQTNKSKPSPGHALVEDLVPAQRVFVRSRTRVAIVKGVRFSTESGAQVRVEETDPVIQLLHVIPGLSSGCRPKKPERRMLLARLSKREIYTKKTEPQTKPC